MDEIRTQLATNQKQDELKGNINTMLAREMLSPTANRTEIRQRILAFIDNVTFHWNTLSMDIQYKNGQSQVIPLDYVAKPNTHTKAA